MRKIKVLHVVEDLKSGGLEKVLMAIVLGLPGERFEPEVVCLNGLGEIADLLAAGGIRVTKMDIDKTSIPNIRKLKDVFLDRRVDILHLHAYAAGTIGRIAGIFARVPIMFYHLHTTPWSYGYKQMLTERLLGYFTDQLVCVSSAVKDFAVSRWGLQREKVAVVYPGLPASAVPTGSDAALSRQTWRLGEDVVVVAVIASLVGHKGHRFLLEAFALVARQRPRVHLLVVGDGPLRSELMGLAESLGIGSCVTFTGFFRPVERLLAAVDIVVLPSSEREGFGLALLEAMRSAKPVVASRIGGIPEIVADGVTGVLVEPKNAGALSSAMIDLVDQKEKRTRMGQEGRALFENKFTLDKMMRGITGLYEAFIRTKLKEK